MRTRDRITTDNSPRMRFDGACIVIHSYDRAARTMAFELEDHVGSGFPEQEVDDLRDWECDVIEREIRNTKKDQAA